MNWTQDPWALMRSGATEEALQRFQRAYAQDPDASSITELAIAYLWIEDYRAAWEHLHDGMRNYPHTMSIFFGMAGVAKWGAQEPAAAVDEWRAGLSSEYTDWAGGIELPLLLVFASAVTPNIIANAEARSILEMRMDNPYSKAWPGPIAEYLLGRISEPEVRKRSVDNIEIDTHLNSRMVDFYVGVSELVRGNKSQFKTIMSKLADTNGPEWSDERYFLGAIWCEEFFLARIESRRVFD